MNSKAFFSFALALCFGFFLLSFNSTLFQLSQSFSNSLNSALLLENASTKRSIAESNTDFLIEKTIEQQVLLKQDSSQEIVSAVSGRLSEYLSFLESNGFTALEAEFNVSNYSLLSRQGASRFNGFQGLFKANVVKFKEATIVDFSYSGGLSGRTLFFASVKPLENSVFFLIPFNYSVRKMVVS